MMERSRRMDYNTARSFLEQILKSGFRINRSALRPGSFALVRREVIAEIGLLSIRDPFGLRLAASVVRARIIVGAIKAAVNVRTAVWAIIHARDVAFDSYFIATVVTNHDSHLAPRFNQLLTKK